MRAELFGTVMIVRRSRAVDAHRSYFVSMSGRPRTAAGESDLEFKRLRSAADPHQRRIAAVESPRDLNEIVNGGHPAIPTCVMTSFGRTPAALADPASTTAFTITPTPAGNASSSRTCRAPRPPLRRRIRTRELLTQHGRYRETDEDAIRRAFMV